MPRRRSSLLSFALLLAAAATLSEGCASARLRRQTAAGIREADALVARGCHACLLDALAIYERLRPRDLADRQLVDRRVVRTSLLLALRSKEIGLAAQPHLERARARAGASPSAADRERLVLADALPSNPSGLSREQQEREGQRFGLVRKSAEAWLERDRRLSDDRELDAYLDLALVCAGRVTTGPPGRNRAAWLESMLPNATPGPLLAYRLGACGLDQEARLEDALAAEPRFAEAFLFVGRYRLIAGRGARTGGPPAPSPRDAREALGKAFAAFPDSPAIAMELANITRSWSVREALPLYTGVIARVPDHQDAWLGKGMCESYLGRHADAIASFTRLLELGRWLVGQAYYWRAWNRHQMKELDLAWSDVETAKQTLYNADLYTLAGVIAYDRKELDVARPHLEKGLELQSRNCTAAWYLGLVHAGQERWGAAGDTFMTAADCYRQDAADARRDLVLAEAAEDEPEIKAERIASARAAIEDSVRQEALSAYNAAYGFVRAQHADRARPLLELARQHADVKVRADELLAYVDRR